MMSGQVLKFKSAQVPKQQGEQARLKVVMGPDSGTVFVISSLLATIGRGDESHVMVLDRKASRKHAEVAFDENSRCWKVRDLDSANGIEHNGKPTKVAVLKSGDSISFGETTMEFWLVEVGTQILTAPPKSIQQIRNEQVTFDAQRAKVRGEASAKGLPPTQYSQTNGFSKASSTSGGNNRLLVYGGAAAVLIFLFMSGEDKKPVVKDKAKEASRELANFLPPGTVSAPPETNRTIDQFYKSGFREFREKNYLRAKNSFEMVLQLSPAHVMARRYLDNCNKEIEAEVKYQLAQGVNNRKSGKMKAAKGNFESVMRLLFRDTENPDFIQAKDALEKLKKDPDKDGGAT